MSEQTIGLAHELWAMAQLAPGEGIEDGAARIAERLERDKFRPLMREQPRPTPKPRTDEAIRLLERLHWDVKKLPFCRVLASLEQSETELTERDERIRELEADLERERMRLAACGVVALADTPESAIKARDIHHSYHSASCVDVARRVDDCIGLRLENAKLREALERIGLYKGEGGPFTPWQDIVRSLGEMARQALAGEGEG